LAKTTVRLHPRRGKPADHGSKIGGTFLWPADEKWPECDKHQCSLVTALQLREEDVPEVGFKGASDLFQVLWCPNDHEPGYGPSPQVFWRKQAEINNPLGSPPTLTRFDKEYVPQSCVLSPERVVEYPHMWELSDDLRKKIDESEELKKALEPMPHTDPRKGGWQYPYDARLLYFSWLSTADGTKVGGYPGWIQDPEYPPCSCGATMEYLVSFASSEFDSVSWGRWLPLDEREVLNASYGQRIAVQSAAGWMFGDAGALYLFICRNCQEWPVKTLMQGSWAAAVRACTVR
jgi:Domain of unknown function (DUF1963)